MLNFGERFGEEEIEEMVKQADTDDDGFIDFTEFVSMITHENVEQQTHSKVVTSSTRVSARHDTIEEEEEDAG